MNTTKWILKLWQKLQSKFHLNIRERENITKAILNNDLLSKIDIKQIEKLVDLMVPILVAKETFIIVENEDGDGLYVIEGNKNP